MYLTVCEYAGLGKKGFVPPVYCGPRLTEAVAVALKIARTTPETAFVYSAAEGKEPDPRVQPYPYFICFTTPTGSLSLTFNDVRVPIELYKRGFPEIDALYESQNPRP